ncbi:MAG: class II aldolase/adducin family protein [Blautia sp.]|nr:class II aldolase/adducin family protein [Blautia sp.]
MLEELKSAVIQIGRQAQRDGLCKHKSGNFSARDAETGYFVITPSAVDREVLTPEDMIVMDVDCHVIEYRKGLRPSSESLMHAAVYRSRPELRGIVHTHSKYATVFATLGRAIPPMVNEMMALNNKDFYIRVAEYGRAGTRQLADNVAAALKDADCALMYAHGAIAVDAQNIEGAYLKACYIEEMAEVYHHVLAISQGKEAPILPFEELHDWGYPEEIKF